MLADMELFVQLLALSLLLTIFMSFWYTVSRITGRYDVVDSAWGLGFVLVAWLSLVLRNSFGAVQVVSTVLVSLWGLRLFVHLANRNWRKSEDDKRYQILREKWGSSERIRSFTNIFLLQGGLVLIISAPVIAISTHTAPWNFFGYVGIVLWLGGIVFETIADWQLTRFVANRPEGSHEIMQRGLWRYSRHPNYFGEITAWWGAAVVAWSVGGWWGIIGALTITLLITKISGIPLLEKRYAADKRYDSYRKRTSVLIPLPPRS